MQIFYVLILSFVGSEAGNIFSSLIRKYKLRKGLILREDIYLGNLPIAKDYDFVIVGASPSGCVIANKLTENPNVKVLLLEAGAEENTYTDIPALATYSLFTQYNWKYNTAYREGICRAMVNGTCTWPSGKAIGGGSVINGMVYTRGNRRDFDVWAEAGNVGWGYDDILKYFIEIEDMQIDDLKDSPYHGTKGNLTISYPNYRSGVSDRFIRAGEQMGFQKVDYNREGTHIGFSRIQSAMRNGRRCSASKAFLYPVRKRPNLHISQGSFVTKIDIDKNSKRAVGVEFTKKGRQRFVKAKREVILAAGAFNSPQLLMLSGIGPAEHLEEFGIPVIKNLRVGDNLQEHMGTTSLTFTLDKWVVPNYSAEVLALPIRIFEWEKTGNNVLSSAGCETVAYFKSSYAEPGDSPDIELLQIAAAYNSDNGANLRKNYAIRDDIYKAVYKELEGKPTFSVWVMGLYPLSKGSVRLNSKNPFTPPKIDSNFIDYKQDVDVIIQGIRIAIKLIESPALQEIGTRLHTKPLPNCTKYTFNSDSYWECFVREITSQFHHQSGTCKMGPISDPTAVVDHRLHVYGIKSLRVADASIFPRITGGHTLAPSYMVGAKAADMIKEEYPDLFYE
ncbi:glucose dehydrogenase [FAD, quinone]-like isoform X2 [Rhodnius prolixus]